MLIVYVHANVTSSVPKLEAVHDPAALVPSYALASHLSVLGKRLSLLVDKVIFVLVFQPLSQHRKLLRILIVQELLYSVVEN